MSRVFVFIVKRVLKKIKPDSKRRKWLMNAKQVLKGNPEIGDKISPKRTPRYYKNKYGVLFVFRYPTPEAHRIIYIIKKVKGNKHVIIVDFLNHTEYDKRFGY